MTVVTVIATWFGCGRLPWAPGSWGSLAALPFAWLVARYAGTPGVLAAAAALFAVGWWASDAVARRTHIKDPRFVVVDEVAGQFLTLAFVPADFLLYGAGFVLFRLFDIWKPWPASWADRELSGGLGIMLDDIFAALYAALVLAAGRFLLER